MLNYFDVIKAQSGIPVDDIWARIWGTAISDKYVVLEYTGTLPITINADGDALLDYRIYGADGGVGERVDITGLSEPLCGIQNYTDSLDLSTGILTRRIEKIVLTGNERISKSAYYSNAFTYNNSNISTAITRVFSTHFEGSDSVPTGDARKKKVFVANAAGYVFNAILFGDWQFSGNADDFKAYLAAQYDAGTPVTVWYVLKEPDVSTISIPPALTGTIEGYLIQDVTPTPEAPIYPTANGVKQADGTYSISIEYSYKLPMVVSDGNTSQTVPVYIGTNPLDSVEGVADYVDKSSDKIVRMISEYTFTGDESINKYGSSDVFYTSKTIDPVGITTVNTITMRCNHPALTAIENKDTRYWLNPEADNICCFLPGGMSQVFLRSTSNFTTAAECKAYLKAQYDNGTPVKISYWLKTPVEEDPPISLPEIPTIEGETMIDYDGTVKPSKIYLRYMGKE